MKLIFTESVRTDLVRLRNFIAQNNSAAATKAAERIKSIATLISENPLIGHAVYTPYGIREDIRDFPLIFGSSGYLLRYQIRPKHIQILRIWHAKEKKV
ncbi:MAG: type II toxin-antitoxin system RelE/ParE family toxin [Nitrospirae bacterium]|nr:type II toxin-antitoxin system RelE/ParE family toxin [Nitrospirota bacterium]